MWPLLLLGGLFAVGKTSSCDEGIFGIDSVSGYDVFGWDNSLGLWGNDCPSRYPKREQVTSKVVYSGGVVDPYKPSPNDGWTFGGVLDELSGRSTPGKKPSLTPVYIAGAVAVGAIMLSRKGKR